MYLSAVAVNQVLTDITRHVKHFSVSFDYVTEEVIANTTGDPEITSVVQRFATIISDVRSLADKVAATILENVKVADLYRAYCPTQSLDSPIYDYYSICTLQVVEQ